MEKQMPYFDHVACTALEQLSARAHPHNLSSPVGLFWFSGESLPWYIYVGWPHHPQPVAAGVSDDVHWGWKDGVRTLASLHHFSFPLIPFFSMAFQVSIHRDRVLHKQQPNLAHVICLEGNISLWYLDLHMNLGTIQSHIQGRRLKQCA